MSQNFEMGNLMSLGTDLVTWTSPRTSLSVSTPPHSVPLIPCLCGPGLVLYQTNWPSDLAQKEKRGPPGSRRDHQEWL